MATRRSYLDLMKVLNLCLAIASPIFLFLFWTEHKKGFKYRIPTQAAIAQALKIGPNAVSLDDVMAENGIAIGSAIFIRIFKESRELELWLATEDGDFDLIKTYPICSFSGTLGPKRAEGDMQSPEGFYTVSRSALLPTSQFHRAFNIGYPNVFDRANGRTGSYLMVHGSCASVGCYAMTDAGISEIYKVAEAALTNGQSFFRVHIFPFRMTEENMVRHAGNANNLFWRNLQEGYLHFESEGQPPDVTVDNRNYVFSTS